MTCFVVMLCCYFLVQVIIKDISLCSYSLKTAGFSILMDFIDSLPKKRLKKQQVFNFQVYSQPYKAGQECFKKVEVLIFKDKLPHQTLENNGVHSMNFGMTTWL